MKKRILSILLTVCMVISMLPMSVSATEVKTIIDTTTVQDNVPPAVCENHQQHTTGVDGCGYIEAAEGNACTHECELCKVAVIPASELKGGASVLGATGDFTVTGGILGTDYTFEDDVLKIKSGSLTVANNNPNVETTHRIEVTSSAIINLAGVNINVSTTKNAAAFTIAGVAGGVLLTLEDDSVNTLKSGSGCAGLHKENSEQLTITGKTTGTGALTATGGSGGAGIGCGYRDGSYITIEGGTITAIGGDNGAGIGGGSQSDGIDITIKGGTVTATGGSGGAGIGGGGKGNGGEGKASNITISGGTVTANGGSGGSDIGGGGGTASGIVIKGGNVNASSIGCTPTNGQSPSAAVELYTLTVTTDGTTPLASKAITEVSATSAIGYTYGITDVKTDSSGKLYAYLPASKTAVSVTAGGQTYIGTVTSNTATLKKAAPAFTVTGGSSGTDYAYQNDVLTVKSGTALTIANIDPNTPTTDRIEITSAANITLAGVNIDVSGTDKVAAFNITSAAGAVTLTLADGSMNTLKSGKNSAGLQKESIADGTMLTINGGAQGTGVLNATGGEYGAGIGGFGMYYSFPGGSMTSVFGPGVNITISGGTVNANAGWGGAGIGGGIWGEGRNITISGGTVTANGGMGGAGIGGGDYSAGSDITISGGAVTANGGQLGAGIGGGSSGGSTTNITISGGTVNAKGGSFSLNSVIYNGAGIGGGSGSGKVPDGTATNIVISGGSVNASSVGCVPTNGQSTDVELYTLTVTDGTTAAASKAVTAMTVVGCDYYGIRDIKTDGSGKLYVYLPASKTAVSVTAGGDTYSGSVASNAATLKKPSAPTTSVTGVAMDKTTLFLYSNTSPSSGTLVANVQPADATNKAVTWSSSNTAVATVSGGVVTAVGNGTATITATTTDGGKTATCTVIVSTYSDSFTGDSGTPAPPTPKPAIKPTKPTQPVIGNIESKATVDSKGNATVSISDKNITDIITNAKAHAIEKDVNVGDITAVINVTTGGKNASAVTVKLPQTTLKQVIDNKIANVKLVIDNPDITIGMDLKAVTEINRQAQADVQLSATKLDVSKISTDAKNAIGSRPAYDIKATYQNGSKYVSNFATGTVSVEIPYKLENGEKAGNICAVYVDAKGKANYLQKSSCDVKRQSLVFSTNHLSVYGVGYKSNTEKFSDIANHWAKDSIEFMAARGLISGTGNGKFSPDAPMTRGMFVTALGKLANADVSGYKKSSFSDVKSNAYYMGYIEWAANNKVVEGIGAGKFNPDSIVTREQMAAIMERYANAMGFKLPEVHAAKTFSDNSKISASAAASVKRIQMAGILQGKTGNLFDPQGTATKAEVSALLQRFVELSIFSAQHRAGW